MGKAVCLIQGRRQAYITVARVLRSSPGKPPPRSGVRTSISLSAKINDSILNSFEEKGAILFQMKSRGLALKRPNSPPFLRQDFCIVINTTIVFTAWPCMPPRLLSADTSDDATGKLARSYGFVETVHGLHGEGSIWTDNRFTNKFAAMPSLHFRYSLLVGMTIATIPISNAQSSTTSYILPSLNLSHPSLAPKFKILSKRRLLCI